MTKKILVMLLILVVTMNGCGKLEDKQQEKEYSRDMDAQMEYPQPEMIDVLPDESECQEYVRKIWVSEAWENMEDYEDYESFCFTRIEGGKIEGQMMIGRIVKSDYQLYEDQQNAFTISFYGDIKGNEVKCYYQNEYWEKRYFTVQFMDKNQIKIDDKIFRPYHLTDIANLSVLESCPAAMKWGNKEGFYFNFVQIEKAGGIYPDAYLTDEEGNVLYHFTSIYQKDSEIKEILFGDENEDGFDDITIFTGYPGEEANLWIERSFLQRKDGSFEEEFLRKKAGTYTEMNIVKQYIAHSNGITEKEQYKHCEDLVREIQEALEDGSIEALLMTGVDEARRLSEYEIQNFCYLETEGIFIGMLDEPWPFDNQLVLEWYVVEQPEQRQDVMLKYQSEEEWGYIYFRCTPGKKGRMTAEQGNFMEIYFGDYDEEEEYYFLEQDGLHFFVYQKKMQQEKYRVSLCILLIHLII